MTDCLHPCPLRDQTSIPSIDHDRRRFLSASLAASVLAVLSACGDDGPLGGDDDDGTGGGGSPPTGRLTVVLANFPALAADGGIARVDGGSTTPVAVVRVNATTYRAFSMVCPHAGTTITITTGGFRCPNHGAVFNAAGVRTGGQVTSDLRELPVVYTSATQTLTIN
jgi:Rieske Fe-S protein